MSKWKVEIIKNYSIPVSIHSSIVMDECKEVAWSDEYVLCPLPKGIMQRCIDVIDRIIKLENENDVGFMDSSRYAITVDMGIMPGAANDASYFLLIGKMRVDASLEYCASTIARMYLEKDIIILDTNNQDRITHFMVVNEPEEV